MKKISHKSAVRFILLLCTLLLCFSCVKKKDGIDCGGQEIPDLDGSWQVQCASGGGLSYSATLDARCISVTRKINLYSAAGCNPADNTRQINFVNEVFTVVGSSASVSGATEINIQIGDAYVTPMTSTEASNMNVAVYCGYTNWTVGVAQRVYGTCGSDNYGSPGIPLYSIYKVLNSNLYVGTPNGSFDGSTQAKRYNMLSTVYYGRVP